MPNSKHSEKNFIGERAKERRAFLALLAEHGVQLSKSLGQNFLYDSVLLNELAELAGIETGDNVIEVGSGAGSLTESLAARAYPGQVLSSEIDKHLEPLLLSRFLNYSNLKFVFDDALKLNFSELLNEAIHDGRSIRVAANLPYYITTELITKFILELPMAKTMSFMIQEEAADRVLAQVGDGKRYGPLAILVNLFGKARITKRIPRQAFVPEPHVDSVFIVLEKYSIADTDEAACRAKVLGELNAFYSFVLQAFSQRRKTLLNNLKPYGKEALELFKNKLIDLDIDMHVRAEKLSWRILAEMFWLV